MKRTCWLSMPFAALLVLCAATAASAMYHPTLGRFVQRDSMNRGRGESLVEYVGSGPCQRVDPNGLQAIEWLLRLLPGLSAKPTPVPDNIPQEDREWASRQPMKQRCPEGSEKLCTKLRFSFGWSRDDDGGFLSKVGGSGRVFLVSNVGHMLRTLDKEVGHCQCVEVLTVYTHGASCTYGGFRMSGATANAPNIIGDPNQSITGEPDGASGDYGRVDSFGAAIKPVMCKRCWINILSCMSAQGQTLERLQTSTGCKVRGSEGMFVGWTDGRWQAEGGLTLVTPRGRWAERDTGNRLPDY